MRNVSRRDVLGGATAALAASLAPLRLLAAAVRPVKIRDVDIFPIEIPVSPADLLVGDYVTIESREEAGRGVAIRIIIVELPERPAPAR